ncbi:hypothetical protein C2W64_02515 [Brevibacillus laterosporus]|nr:hypothetical protein [Brevibacillus laterosporus]RAP29960.1 hypothetical protein C2W64_02515 [Brevibacillus laterosporus]
MVRHQQLSEANKLANDFQKLFNQREKVELDGATKKEIDEIREQVKNGTLTQEQFEMRMEEKGIYTNPSNVIQLEGSV